MRSFLRKPKIVVPVAAVLVAGTIAAGYAGSRYLEKKEACERISNMATQLERPREQAAQGDGKLLAVLGDSYTQGDTAAVAMSAFPYVAGNALRMPVLAEGSGASGYVAEGPCGNAAFGHRLSKVLGAKPDVLVIEGGLNDQARPGQREAIGSLFSTVKRASHARVIVMAPQTPPGADAGKVSETTALVREAAEANGFEFFDYKWQLEFLPDRMHPTQEGHTKIGQDLAAYIKTHGVAK